MPLPGTPEFFQVALTASPSAPSLVKAVIPAPPGGGGGTQPPFNVGPPSPPPPPSEPLPVELPGSAMIPGGIPPHAIAVSRDDILRFRTRNPFTNINLGVSIRGITLDGRDVWDDRAFTSDFSSSEFREKDVKLGFDGYLVGVHVTSDHPGFAAGDLTLLWWGLDVRLVRKEAGFSGGISLFQAALNFAQSISWPFDPSHAAIAAHGVPFSREFGLSGAPTITATLPEDFTYHIDAVACRLQTSATVGNRRLFLGIRTGTEFRPIGISNQDVLLSSVRRYMFSRAAPFGFTGNLSGTEYEIAPLQEIPFLENYTFEVQVDNKQAGDTVDSIDVYGRVLFQPAG